MSWLKEIIVDILVTFFIAVAFLLNDPWMWWVIAVYTALLLIAKGAALTSSGLLRQSRKSQQAPEWILHVLYAVNVILLGLASWWFLMAGWVLIWLLSYLAQRKVQSTT